MQVHWPGPSRRQSTVRDYFPANPRDKQVRFVGRPCGATWFCCSLGPGQWGGRRLLYHLYELNLAAAAPLNAAAGFSQIFWTHPRNPLSTTTLGRTMAASMEIMERTTRRFRRPEFGINDVKIGDRKIAVTETAVWSKAFCRLLHFKKAVSTK